jgi:hypothetical protein
MNEGVAVVPRDNALVRVIWFHENRSLQYTPAAVDKAIDLSGFTMIDEVRILSFDVNGIVGNLGKVEALGKSAKGL